MPSRWRIPSEYVATLSSRRSDRDTIRESSSMRPAAPRGSMRAKWRRFSRPVRYR